MFGLLLLLLGSVQAKEDVSLGKLVIPLTPSNPQYTGYIGMFELEAAGGATWTSDTPQFRCVGQGDYVEVHVQADAWPSRIPKKVTCTEDGGKRKVKAKIEIKDGLTKAMFAADGTLVMPRQAKTSVQYKGPPPRSDVVVGQGTIITLGIKCLVEAGPTLVVVADSEVKDGSGKCSVKSTSGEVVWIPISIVSVK